MDATKKSGFMHMEVCTDRTNLYVGLSGGHAQTRSMDGGAILYDGPIDGLPADVIEELLERGFIKRTD